MSEAQTIQWFPGHMTRTKRQIEKSLKMVDIVAEIIDARVPVSSRNPILKKLIGNKPRLILMNKSDMADSAATARWIAYYKQKGVKAIALDCRTGKGVNGFPDRCIILVNHNFERNHQENLLDLVKFFKEYAPLYGFHHLGIENDMKGNHRLLGLKSTTNYRFDYDCYAAPLATINV